MLKPVPKDALVRSFYSGRGQALYRRLLQLPFCVYQRQAKEHLVRAERHRRWEKAAGQWTIARAYHRFASALHYATAHTIIERLEPPLGYKLANARAAADAREAFEAREDAIRWRREFEEWREERAKDREAKRAAREAWDRMQDRRETPPAGPVQDDTAEFPAWSGAPVPGE